VNVLLVLFYIVDFVKEDNNWKFAGAERQD